jgi:hypothetical protein
VQVTHFGFSSDEEKVISEQTFFILKSNATKKIIDQFGVIEREMKSRISVFDMNVKGLNISSGKIFRGENYKLFPYILLDYPRLFSKESVFAFRSMFWWGHEFSFTLHLQGIALGQFRNSLFKNYDLLKNKDVFFCVNDTPWQYDFSEENYRSIDHVANAKNEMLTKPFIKLSRKLPVYSHEKVYNYSLETLFLFLSVL